MLRALFELLRPHHWSKNLFCFAGAAFGPNRSRPWIHDALTFAVFCCVSSAVYVLNDVVDWKRDREHPRKRFRPIARGAVSVGGARVLASALGVAGIFGGWLIGPAGFACVCLYLVNNLCYSLKLKHVALFDVLSISFGFVLRLLAGIYAVDDLPTTWIVLCVFFLSLFLGFGKRRAEIAAMVDAQNQETRPVLRQYPADFLDYLIRSSAIMAIMCYALFTTSGGKNPSLVISVPIVFYAIMHYNRLLMTLRGGEEPERILVSDRTLQASIVCWMACYLVIEHGHVHLFR